MKKKKLKIMFIVLAVLIARIIIYPCFFGESNIEVDTKSESQIADTSDNKANGNEIQQIVEPIISEQSNVEEDSKEYIGSELCIEHITNFSEGVAWVEFRESDRKKGSIEAASEEIKAALGSNTDKALYSIENAGNWGNRAALIDTQGKILWETEQTTNNPVLINKHEFIDGISYCVFNGMEKECYYVLDSEGNVTYTMDKDENFIILGHGGGTLLAAKHIADFDTNGDL